MPGTDGYELADILRNDSETRNLPIIFLSAVYSDEPNVFRGYEAGGVEFLTKPFNPDILLSKVRVFLALDDQKTELLGQKARLEGLVAQLDGQVQARMRAEEILTQTNERLEQKVQARTAEIAAMVEALKTANEQLAERAYQLRALAGELTIAEHRERQRISRVLHDGLQQHLVVIKLQLEVLADRLSGDDQKQAAGKIEDLLVEAIRISRSLSADLSPPVLHEFGLSAGLEWLARWLFEKHGFSVDLILDDKPDLAEDVKVLIFESVRELLFNVVKHAGVSCAKVHLQRLYGNIVYIQVRDEGIGFDVDRLKPAGENGGGFGLFSIRERISLVNGKLKIDSAPGKGSCFTLTVPVTPIP